MNIPISILLCLLFTMVTGTITYLFFVIICKINRDTKVLKVRYIVLKVVICAFFVPLYFVFEIVRRHDNGAWINTIFGTTPLLHLFTMIALAAWILGIVVSIFFFYKKIDTYRATLKVYEITTQYDAILSVAKDNIGIKNSVQVRNGDYYESPFCTGIIHSCICLPNGKFTTTELEHIFLHELVHHKHKDILFLGIIQILSIVFWFHPLFQKDRLLLQYRELMEDACDIDVCRHTEDYKRYITVLLRMVLITVELRKAAPVFLSESYEDVRRRIDNMEKYRTQKPLKRMLVTILIAVVFCGSSFAVYAAESGVVAGYQKVYDVTWQGMEEEMNGNTENTLEEVYELAVVDEDITVEYIQEDMTEYSTRSTFDYTISGNTEKRKTTSHSLSAGDKVLVCLSVDPANKNVKVGFYMSNGYVRYITGSGDIYHTFTIYDDDNYTFFVQNNNSTVVDVYGYYTIK